MLPFLGSEVGGEADGSEVGVGTRARAIAARCAERGALSEHYDFRPDVDYTLLRSKVTKATIYRHDPHQRLHHCTPSVAASLGLHHRRQTRHSTLVARLATRSQAGGSCQLRLANVVTFAPVAHRLLCAPAAPTHSFQKMPKKAAVENYEPEKVVGSRGSGKNIEYEVKWVGYKSSENTWEPPANLASCKEVPACHPPAHAVGTRVGRRLT